MGNINKRTPWVALVLLVAYFAGTRILSIVLSLPLYADRASKIEEAAALDIAPAAADIILLSVPEIVSLALASIFCIYVLGWFFNTGRELAGELGEAYNAGLWMFLGLVLGLPMIYVWYKTAKLTSDYSETGSFFKNFLLLLIFPVGIFVIQRDINSRTAFGTTNEGPSYGMLTRFGFLGMEYWWLLAAALIYVAFFAVLEYMPDLVDQLGLF